MGSFKHWGNPGQSCLASPGNDAAENITKE